eukprot:SAG22_NODE_6860_length_802_cov_4.046942_2_plen_101_part_00
MTQLYAQHNQLITPVDDTWEPEGNLPFGNPELAGDRWRLRAAEDRRRGPAAGPGGGAMVPAVTPPGWIHMNLLDPYVSPRFCQRKDNKDNKVFGEMSTEG